MAQQAQRLALTILAVLGTAMAGCQSAGTGQADGEGSRRQVLAQTEPVEIRDHLSGGNDALAEPDVRLIKDQAAANELGLDLPRDVDLSEHDLVLHALGKQNTGGYWVHIDAIQQIGDKLFVQSTINRPASDQAVTQQITYPYALAVIPNTDAKRTTLDYTAVTGQAAP